jgi:hypothetical protein
MSIPIVVSGTIVNFPASGDSPNWAPAIIQFAQLVAAALQFSFGPFDIPPQTYTMTANVNANVALPNLTFPPSQVQGAIINYSVFRSTNTVVATETGQIYINYNSSFPTSQKWEISTSHVGISNTTFSITDVGQVQFSTTSITGTGYTGFVTYQASAILTN